MAAERLRARRTRDFTDPRDVDFLDCVPRLSPHLTRPYWLAPLADVIRRAFLASCGLGEPVRACVSVPSQHGKTSEIEAAMITWLEHRPSDPLLYVTYNEDTARDRGREFRDLAGIAGVKLRDDSRSIVTWDTPEGGGLRCRAINGQITGMKGLRFIAVDDPYKDRAQAESAAIRRGIKNSFTGNVISRLHPQTSVLINHTRWHEDDLIGWLKKEHGERWEFINLPAINDAGDPLWPEGQPLSLLAEKRAMSEYDWWSIYMGQPRSREGKVFQGVSYFDDLPLHRNVAIGVDLAYSGKTSSDWCIAVVMAESAGRYYVLEVVRRQVPASIFAADLAQLQRSYGLPPTVMYASGRDWEQIEVMRKLGVSITAKPASIDKFLRAQPLSAAWNPLSDGRGGHLRDGLVSLRNGAHWLGQYVSVMMDFTGKGDDHDDDVDATAAAFDALPRVATSSTPALTIPQNVVEARPKRDPAISTRGRGRLGTW